VINLVDEANRRRFVRIRVRQFHPNLPDPALINTYSTKFSTHSSDNVAYLPKMKKKLKQPTETGDARRQLSNPPIIQRNHPRISLQYTRSTGEIPQPSYSPGERGGAGFRERVRTFGGALELDEEFLHPIVDHLHLVIAHHPASKPEKPHSRARSKRGPINQENKNPKARKPFGQDGASQLHEVHLAALARGRHLGSGPRRTPPSPSPGDRSTLACG
jgi:hypothetical protein